MIHALQNTNKKQRRVLKKAMKGEKSTNEDIKTAISVLEETGSIEYARKKATKYLDNAIHSIMELTDTAAKKSLIDLVNYFVQRDY